MASDITITSLIAAGSVRQVILSAIAGAPVGMGCLPYMLPAKFEFWGATTNNRALATKVGESAIGLYTHSGLVVNTTRYYWARAIDINGEAGEFFPASATGGIAATTTTTGAGSVDTGELATGAVTETKIENLAVTNAKIGNAAITTAKIQDAAINRAKIQDAAIGSAQIEDAAINRAKIGNAAIGNAQIGNAEIDGAKIANLAVKNAQIDNLTIGTGKYQYNSTYEMAVSGQSGAFSPGHIIQGIGINVRRGAVSVDVSTIIDKPSDGSGNHGFLRVELRRNGNTITSRRLFYDDNFGNALSFTHGDYNVAENSNPYYEAYLANESGSGNYEAIYTVIRLINFRG